MAINRAKDPSYLSGPSVRDVRRSYVEEQYPAFVRNNRPSNADLRRMRSEAAALGYRPPISVLMPTLKPGQRQLERTLDSIVRQVYPEWGLVVCSNDPPQEQHTRELLSKYERLDGRIRVAYDAGQNAGEASMAKLSNAALAMAGGEFVWFLGQGDELAPEALFEVVKLLQKYPEADLIYSDEDTIDEEGSRSEPRFKPDWSPDFLLSTNYISCSSAYRRSLLEEVGSFRQGFEGSQDYDLLLRLTERTERIHHLPRVLYHRRASTNSLTSADGDEEGRTRRWTRKALSEALERRGIEGSVEDGLLPETFRVRPKIQGEPLVSIIVPSRDNVSLLESCIESIERLTEYPNYEILIVDNGSTEPATLEYLEKTPHRVIPFREEFNYSKINNMAASQARGEYLLLLNDDTEVISGGWLGAMLEHAQRPEVGAVGARLLYPDGRVQHAGVVTGISAWGPRATTHAYQFYGQDAAGHMGTLLATTNYSAVTAACMLVRKEVYEEVGGLDEDLPVSFNDVDLCLRIRERGYLIVYTPHAELYHHESVSRGYKANPAELLYLRDRWEGVLDEDPYYNPHFSRGSGDFNLRADLLRPQVLRQAQLLEDTTSAFKSALATGQKELKKFIETKQRATRNSHTSAILPMREDKSVIIAALESLGQDGGPSPRREGQPRGAASEDSRP